jgi:hypothetical protein
MKRIIVAIIVGFLFVQGISAQTEKQISAVDKQWQKIKSNISSFHKEVKVENSTGYRYVYSKGKELQMITVMSKEKDIDKNVFWYFVNGKMIYSEQTWTDVYTGKIVDNEKFYFDNERLFAWIKDSKFVDTASNDFKNADNEFVSYVVKLKEDSTK